jgi:hypothetical protein
MELACLQASGTVNQREPGKRLRLWGMENLHPRRENDWVMALSWDSHVLSHWLPEWIKEM